jgi:hypothetical protein
LSTFWKRRATLISISAERWLSVCQSTRGSWVRALLRTRPRFCIWYQYWLVLRRGVKIGSNHILSQTSWNKYVKSTCTFLFTSLSFISKSMYVIFYTNNHKISDLFNKTDCKGDFECYDGECIDKNLVCNGEYDCKDHSDEIDCHIRNNTCPGQFECLNGSCIDKNLVCNGKNNCPDGSDEKGCHKHPTNGSCAGKFECTDGNCVDKNKVCDGKNDCPDKSDETGCHVNINRVLLYVLIGLAGVLVILLVVVVIVLCCKYCCISFRMASVYRKLS